MPRTLEFEIEPALDAVVEEFRHSGFGGTSIKALERVTGLSSGSLYNSFGDKDALFRRALAHYTAKVVDGRLDEHLTHAEPLAGLRALFLTLLDEPDGGSDGCLLTNSAIEFGCTPSPALDAVRHGLDRQEAAFADALERLRPADPRNPASACALLALYQGVLVLIRSGYPKPQLSDMIETTLATL